jgi:hypothetical protein
LKLAQASNPAFIRELYSMASAGTDRSLAGQQSDRFGRSSGLVTFALTLVGNGAAAPGTPPARGAVETKAVATPSQGGAQGGTLLVDILPHGAVLTDKGAARSQSLLSAIHASLPSPMSPLAIGQHLRSRTPFVFLNLTKALSASADTTIGGAISPAAVAQAVFRAVRAGSDKCGDRGDRASKAYFKLSSNWNDLLKAGGGGSGSSANVRYDITAKGVNPINGRETTHAFVLEGGDSVLSSQKVKNDLQALSALVCSSN